MTSTLGSPDDESTVQTRGGVLRNLVSCDLECLNAADGVLVLGVELSLVGGRSETVLVLKHVHGSLCLLSSGSLSSIDLLSKLPATSVGESGRGAVVSNGDELCLRCEEEISEWKIAMLDDGGVDLSGGDIGKVKGGILVREGQDISRGRPGDRLDPSIGGDLGNELSKGCFCSHGDSGGALIDSLDEGREDSGLVVGGSGGEESVRRVPCDVCDGGGVILDVLRHPPIVVGLERTDGDEVSSASHSKLVLMRRPLDVSGGTVDSEDNKDWLPFVTRQSPHVSISVLRAGDDTVGLGGPVDTCDDLVVLGQLVFQGVGVSSLLVDVDLVVVGADGDLGSISVPRVGGDRGDTRKLSNIRHVVWSR